jgi:hypothetical protein
MATPPLLQGPEDDPDGVHLRLSAQRALLGVVGPSVRVVAVSYRGQTILFEALLDPNASDDEREALEVAATEIVADYPSGWRLDVQIGAGADDLPDWPSRVYQRRGPHPNDAGEGGGSRLDARGDRAMLD